MKVVDARGMTCPKPVILTKQAIDSGETEIEVLVDNDVSFQNVKRFLGSRGYRVVEEGKREDGILSFVENWRFRPKAIGNRPKRLFRQVRLWQLKKERP